MDRSSAERWDLFESPQCFYRILDAPDSPASILTKTVIQDSTEYCGNLVAGMTFSLFFDDRAVSTDRTRRKRCYTST